MKILKTVFLASLLFSFSLVTAQNRNTRSLVASIENDYKIENGNVLYEKIYEFSNKTNDELFNSSLDFLENFTDAKIQIISNDPNRGKIKSWGFLKDYYSRSSFGISSTISASYNISIDIKEGRTRLRIIAVDYFEKEDGSGLANALSSVAGSVNDYDISSSLYQAGSEANKIIEGDFKVKDLYPFTNSRRPNLWGPSFYNLNNHIVKTMDSYEKYMKSNVSDKW